MEKKRPEVILEIQISKRVAEVMESLARHDDEDRDKYITKLLMRHALPYICGRIDGMNELTEITKEKISEAIDNATNKKPPTVV